MVIIAFNKNETETNRRLIELAWSIEALHRVERLPRLETLLGQPIAEQSDEEITAVMLSWVAEHNAKYEQRRRLGFAEVGE